MQLKYTAWGWETKGRHRWQQWKAWGEQQADIGEPSYQNQAETWQKTQWPKPNQSKHTEAFRDPDSEDGVEMDAACFQNTQKPERASHSDFTQLNQVITVISSKEYVLI